MSSSSYHGSEQISGRARDCEQQLAAVAAAAAALTSQALPDARVRANVDDPAAAAASCPDPDPDRGRHRGRRRRSPIGSCWPAARANQRANCALRRRALLCEKFIKFSGLNGAATAAAAAAGRHLVSWLRARAILYLCATAPAGAAGSLSPPRHAQNASR